MEFKNKKKVNKFNKNKKFKKPGTKKPFKVKHKVKQHVREDDEIKKLQEEYENIKNCKDIKTFDDFPLSRKTRKGLTENKLKIPTEIQKQAIGPGLKGCDVLGASKTGSGKTLAFLIPILENLFIKKWSRMDGVGAIIISPTRELAYQIFETLKKVGAHHDFSSGLIIGGKNLKFEKSRMDQVNIIICTPGRLLQHMDENPLFNCDSMQILVLDEADRCLDLGFSHTMNGIIENLPTDRQTLLFSATQTKSVKDLARLSLKSPVYVAPHEKSDTTTPKTLHQNYVVFNQEEKIMMLWSFIKTHQTHKSIVFMSSCKQVKFVYEMFSKLRPGISLLALYGTLHQDRRMAIYDEFCKRSKVVLFATDIASRGLDFPVINWVIQLDCPEDATAYIHRAGRTARHDASGESLLVLTPHEEEPMIEELKANKIPIEKISIDPKQLFSPRVKMEAYLAQSKDLKDTAQRAFIAYIKSVFLMKNKKVFDVESINFDEFAKSLGLVVTPRVRFLQRLKKRKEQQLKGTGTGDNEQSESSENENIEDDEDNKKQQMKSINLSALMADESDDDDAGLVRVKRKDHDIEIGSNDEMEVLEELNQARKQKLVTKAAVAKKLAKKKIVPNKKITFDDDGNVVTNTAKELQSELAKDYMEEDEGGIDIEKAKQLLQEEDKFDRKRFKELVKQKHREIKKKRKQKKEENKQDDEEEGDDFESGSEPDLSWLPDYDKINAKSSKSDDDADSDNESQSDDDSDEGPIHKLPTKLYEKKRPKDEESEEEVEMPQKKKSKKNIASKLNLNDAEALAMSLIGA
ncbi:probable ATP-dependent RNA helicase DDX10 [Chironomus tepperi]|uniref:probable ATP-dependent RNA helicase DDX10 n=1 Tax=Chironomus tepperi TaxID=113505 RepID=UPI00391FB9B3